MQKVVGVMLGVILLKDGATVFLQQSIAGDDETQGRLRPAERYARVVLDASQEILRIATFLVMAADVLIIPR